MDYNMRENTARTVWKEKIRLCPCHKLNVGRRIDDFYAHCPVTGKLFPWLSCEIKEIVHSARY